MRRTCISSVRSRKCISMNILLCHERFLFRFGADRTLILLGRDLQKLSHSVTILANRYDTEILRCFASRIIDCPVEGTPYIELNEFTAEWLRANWERLFDFDNAPDVIIVGGWPFFSAIPFFREVCDRVIFIDFGAVPLDGYPEETRIILEKLRSLRKLHLPSASLIVPISRFLAESQSKPDSGNVVPVHAILLGADHLETAVWRAAELQLGVPRESALQRVQSLKQQGKSILLCLGRWEAGCYKNSQAALDFMEKLSRRHPQAVLLVLDDPSRSEAPSQLNCAIERIGFPDDAELVHIINQTDVGLCFSLWEGFNLPLAEMQWFGRPALVFNVAAHPEVIAHPWYLCQDLAEMVDKTAALLSGHGPPAQDMEDASKAFRSYFRWDRFLAEWSEILEGAVGFSSGQRLCPAGLLIIDVTNSTRDTANSGVVRVTRRLSRSLQQCGADPIFVIWDDAGRYVLPTRAEYEVLARFNGPLFDGAARVSSTPEQRTSLDDVLAGGAASDPWLLIPEVKAENSFERVRRFARDRNFRIAAIFYDAIPVLHPDLCNNEISENHGRYMLGLAKCDLAVPISNYSAKCLRDFWRDSGVVTSCAVSADVLPGEFSGSVRSRDLRKAAPDKVDILCVSTLEPRKNHRSLIYACLWMAASNPDLNWSLTLVGNRYEGAFEIADWIQSVSARDGRIEWLGIVDDATLDRLYEKCSFTVYPSIIEGFGLPILESIWHGRPCICSGQGVMAELADGGGCLTTDVEQPLSLADTIYELATDRELQLRLCSEAIARPLKTWKNYIAELLSAMARNSPRPVKELDLSAASSNNIALSLWQEALYPGCLCEKWQMNDSERMALTGLLARHRPHCSVEIGTYWAGSLSLISQYSKMVFSIDTDECVRSRFSLPNVSLLTGPSTAILPYLLGELDKARIPLDFILIDGDHSANSIKADVACLLTYVPKKPLFVVMHDSFNPECRRGMLEAPWNASPYCHWIDIDFVPGRMVETPGPLQGELWGGLAAAYFLPRQRNGELQVHRTAEQMFQTLAGQRAATVAAGC